VIRKIAQIQKRLAEIDEETRQLTESDLSQLKTKVDDASSQGRDLLNDMASQVDQQLAAAKKHLAIIVDRNATL
jgi:hypothetical protein